jgi:hypothetical protein
LNIVRIDTLNYFVITKDCEVVGVTRTKEEAIHFIKKDAKNCADFLVKDEPSYFSYMSNKVRYAAEKVCLCL